MSRNDLNMEDLFRTQMETYQVDPSPGLWQKVHSRILWKQFMGFSFQTFNVYYLALAVSLAGLGSFALLSGPDSKFSEPAAQVRLEEEPGIPPSPAEPISPDQSKSSGQQVFSEENKSQQNDYPRKPSQNLSSDDEAAGEVSSAGSQIKEDPKDPEISKNQAAQSNKKSESLTVRVDFTASQLEGCSPLAVDFHNTSENAVQTTWLFGDGGSSSEKDPSYVFDEAGEYSVTLKIIGADELEYSTQQTITVFQSPKALFEMDENVDLSTMQPVYFYNYSRGADFYAWDFGDNEYSSLVEPIHYYDQAGSYNVTLKVWTINQCYDSLEILNAFNGPESEILFPNAFTPNMSGPTGGYYEINDINNTVFHPVVTGELIEYQLKIFNRQGLQIFESNDVSTGWDGYYQEKLAGQAVYIWKARGKFSNGKTFVKSGDVTLVRQY